MVAPDGAVVHADGAVVTRMARWAPGWRGGPRGWLGGLPDGAVVYPMARWSADGSVVHADGLAQTANLNELSPSVAAETGNVPGPTKLTACVIGVGACVHPDTATPTPQQLHRIRLDWEPPT